jgi:N,N'-diacetyllegionaminate synthase
MAFNIGNLEVGNGRCLIIGEVAQSHDGSLGMAHAYIDAIANAGADAVKFQTHIAEAESSYEEPWRVKFSKQDSTRFEYWRRMEFSEVQWIGLKSHAEQRGLIFLSSPFSIQAVDLLDKLGIQAWKVASGEINNIPLLEKMIATGKPLLLSSGMSYLEELDNAVAITRKSDAPFALMQCTSSYPTSPEETGLNLIHEFKTRFGCPIGFSDHSGNIFSGLAAVTLGISLLEVHVTLSREMFGPDVVASITTDELKILSKGVRFIETALANPVEKDVSANSFKELRGIFTKSLFVLQDLEAGSTLEFSHLIAKKPGSGIPVKDLDKVLGRTIRNNLSKGAMLRYEDVI